MRLRIPLVALGLMLFGPPQARRFGPDPFGEVLGKIEYSPGYWLPGARVRVADAPGLNLILDQTAGVFRIPRIPSGSRNILVDWPDRPELGVARFPVGVMREQAVTMGTLVFTQPGSIYGRVQMTKSAENLANIIIKSDTGQASLLNSDGMYLMDDVPPGRRTVTLTADGYDATTQVVVSPRRVSRANDFVP